MPATPPAATYRVQVRPEFGLDLCYLVRLTKRQTTLTCPKRVGSSRIEER